MRVNSTRSRTRWLNLAIGFGTTAGFVWLLTRGLDWGALGQAFAGLSVSMALLALVFLAIGYMVRIVRWWWMLRALEPRLPLDACIGPFLSSIAVNNVLPFRAGDILRVLGFRRQLRSPAARVLVTVVVERVLDLTVLVGVFFLGLLSLPEGAFPRNFTVAVIWITGAGLAVIAALPLFALWYGHIGDRLPRHRFFSARRWPESVSRHGAHLVEALDFMRSLPRMLSHHAVDRRMGVRGRGVRNRGGRYPYEHRSIRSMVRHGDGHARHASSQYAWLRRNIRLLCRRRPCRIWQYFRACGRLRARRPRGAVGSVDSHRSALYAPPRSRVEGNYR